MVKHTFLGELVPREKKARSARRRGDVVDRWIEVSIKATEIVETGKRLIVLFSFLNLDTDEM